MTAPRPGSKRFTVKLISKYLRYLNSKSSNIFQRPRNPCKSFNPAKDEVWFCSVPLGNNSLKNMLRGMTSRAGIQPYLTNHSVKETTVTVLLAANYESRQINATTDHQSNTPTFHQIKAMSNAIADFVGSGYMLFGCVFLYIHLTLASPDENPVKFNSHKKTPSTLLTLVHGLILGGTFHSYTFSVTVNL